MNKNNLLWKSKTKQLSKTHRVAQLQRDCVIAFEKTFCNNLKLALITTESKSKFLAMQLFRVVISNAEYEKRFKSVFQKY